MFELNQNYYWKDYLHTNYLHWFYNIETMGGKKAKPNDFGEISYLVGEQRARELAIYNAMGLKDWNEFETFILNYQQNGPLGNVSKAVGKAKRSNFGSQELITKAEYEQLKVSGSRKRKPKRFLEDYGDVSKELANLHNDLTNATNNFSDLMTDLDEAIRTLLNQKKQGNWDAEHKKALQKMFKYRRDFKNAKKTLSKLEGGKIDDFEAYGKELDGIKQMFRTAAKSHYGILYEYAGLAFLAKLPGVIWVRHTGAQSRDKNRNIQGKRDLAIMLKDMEFGISVKSTSQWQMEKGKYGVSLHSGTIAGLKDGLMVGKQSRTGETYYQLVDQMIWYLVNFIKLSSVGSINGRIGATLNGPLESQPDFDDFIQEPLQAISALFIGDSESNALMSNDFLLLKDRIYPKSVIMEAVWNSREKMQMFINITNSTINVSNLMEFDQLKRDTLRSLGDTDNKEHKAMSAKYQEYTNAFDSVAKSTVKVSLKGNFSYENLVKGG